MMRSIDFRSLTGNILNDVLFWTFHSYEQEMSILVHEAEAGISGLSVCCITSCYKMQSETTNQEKNIEEDLSWKPVTTNRQ